MGAVYFLMSEPDVKLAMRQPWVSVGTDYGAINPTGPLGESKAHPRAYGSFARILGKYVLCWSVPTSAPEFSNTCESPSPAGSPFVA